MDHNAGLPPGPGWRELGPDEIAADAVFIDPETGLRYVYANGGIPPDDFGIPLPSEAFLKAQNPLGIWDAGDDDYIIPPRGWLLGAIFCRQFLSSLLADGGVGKTAVRMAQLLSLAIGRSLTGEHVFQRCHVLILSLEDSRDELRRRVYALLRHYRIAPADLKGWLFLAAPKGIRLAEMKDGVPMRGPLKD